MAFLRRAPRRFQPALHDRLEERELPSGLAAQVSSYASRPPSGTVKLVANQVYTSDGSQLDVYAPARGTPPAGGWPAILAIQGGGWQWARRSAIGDQLSGLTARGFVVVPLDHVYARPGGPPTWPAAAEDVRNAVRWVRSHAASLGVNPDKLVLLGDSSGGHLATLAGMLPDGPISANGASKPSASNMPRVSARVQAVVDFYGPMDLVAEWNQKPKVRPYLATFLGGSPTQVPGRYKAASPLTYINAKSPPTFIAQGTADTTIPVSQSKALAAALTRAGIRNKLVLVGGAPHGFMFGLRSQNMNTLVKFLNSVLKIPAR